MVRKNDLTALLPFPTRTPKPDRVEAGVEVGVEPHGARARRRDEPTSRSGPLPVDQLVQLDQLDLSEMVRHHASSRNARRAAATRGEVRATLRSAPSSGARRTREAGDATSSSDGAVPSSGFYLDLIGSVTVMALVLLAAILV